jgi:hypothetical protein
MLLSMQTPTWAIDITAYSCYKVAYWILMDSFKILSSIKTLAYKNFFGGLGGLLPRASCLLGRYSTV